MDVLVAVASRHGSTREIARAIQEELQRAGLYAEVRDAGEVSSIEGYDAVIIGSAVYMGDWLPDARRFVEVHAAPLATLPVWLFSSGPVGDPDPQPSEAPRHLPDVVVATRARDHQLFLGRLDLQSLAIGERFIAQAVHAPVGDFRDWRAIRSWARSIAAALTALEKKSA